MGGLRVQHRRERESRDGAMALDQENARRAGDAHGEIQILRQGGGHGGRQDLRRVAGRLRRAALLEEVQRRVGAKYLGHCRPFALKRTQLAFRHVKVSQ